MNRRSASLIAIIFLAAVCAFAQEAQPNGSQIRETIEKRVKGIPVEVRVDNGTAALTGTVPTFDQKRQALDMARRTIGVKEVVDRIKVLPPEPHTDKEILEAVRDSLAKNLGKDTAGKIEIAVTGGVVTLTGTLPSSYPKMVAGYLAGLTAGAVDINNSITVRPTIARTDPAIEMDLRSRIRRNALLKDQDVDARVKSGVVTLTGTVATLRQVQQAEAIARFTPGVAGVDNRLFFRD